MDEYIKKNLKKLFKGDKDKAEFAIIYFRHLINSSVGISREELNSNVISELLSDEGYTMGGSDYREREEELKKKLEGNSDILDTLIEKNLIVEDKQLGVEILSLNPYKDF